MGEAPEQMLLVETAEDVQRLNVTDPRKVAYLTQTTLSVDDANVVIAALHARFPHIANPRRMILLRDAEPSRGRSRTGGASGPGAGTGQPEQLQQPKAGRDRRIDGIPAHLVDGVSEIQKSWFDQVENVLITAGASAPEDVVQDASITL